MWEINLVEEVEDWYLNLGTEEELVAVRAAINLLEQEGPTLGRPVVDRVKGSNLHNLKELRPSGTSIRILFVFDPMR